MSYPFSKLSFTAHNRMTSAVVGVSLAAVGTAIYLSPAGNSHHTTTAPQAAVQNGLQSPNSVLPPALPSSSAASSSSSASSSHPSSSHPGTSSGSSNSGSGNDGGGGFPVPGPTKTVDGPVVKKTSVDVVHVTDTTNKYLHTTSTVPGPTQTDTQTVTAPAPGIRILHCNNFKWQQDAQAAYVANLSDPGALDGAVGPHNGNGLACDSPPVDLPVDPSRAKSVPVDPYEPPTVTAPTDTAVKADLVDPGSTYFGLAEDGLPGDTSLLNKLDDEAGKAPSLVEYFQDLDDNFRSDLTQAAWKRGALPVVTMQTQGSVPGKPYSLASIVDGSWDSYFKAYADAVRLNGQVIAIRFDHEMNGNWYPWSAGKPANQGAPGDPNLYVQAWRHVWDIFQGENANNDVIWAWTPIRIDGLNTADTTPCLVAACQQQTSLAEDYPGDQYVDWVGFSGYAWKPPTTKWHASNTYDKTMAALKKLTSKPIFIAETGASQDTDAPAVDATAAKTNWITESLSYLKSDPRIVGFVYFNNNTTAAHNIGGVPVVTNWQIDSNPTSLAAFKAGISDVQYQSGIMPDGVGS